MAWTPSESVEDYRERKRRRAERRAKRETRAWRDRARMGTFLAGLAGIALAGVGLYDVSKVSYNDSWTKTPSEAFSVSEFEYETGGGRRHYRRDHVNCSVGYTFVAGGKRYKGSLTYPRLPAFESILFYSLGERWQRARVKSVVNWFEGREAVTVVYDPDEPKWSSLRTRYESRIARWGWIQVAAGIALAIAGFFANRVTRSIWPEPEDQRAGAERRLKEHLESKQVVR